LVNSCAKYLAWYGVSFIASYSSRNGPATIAAASLAPVEKAGKRFDYLYNRWPHLLRNEWLDAPVERLFCN
jgi:hypothetical protein